MRTKKLDGDILLAVIAYMETVVSFLNILNTLHHDNIHEPRKRQHIHAPSLYMERSKYRFPTHPLSKTVKTSATKMTIQTIRRIWWTKDVGAEWYILLVIILVRIFGMVPATRNKGFLYRQYEVHTTFLELTTDNILLGVTDRSLYLKIQTIFDNHFVYATIEGGILKFFNSYTIQSKHGTSVDQYNNIIYSMSLP